MSQSILEKLQLTNEKNILIQGLPSSIEKQFSKLSFAKNLTPLLRSRKIDFALIFAVSESQLNAILEDIMPALKEESKLWIACPKPTSKITTDLNRECSWNKLADAEYENMEQVSLDHVWQAAYFKRIGIDLEIEGVATTSKKKEKLASI